jgi:predicted ATPase
MTTGNLKTRGIGVTRVTLKPLPEEDITKYVAVTMSRPVEDIIPLSAVIQAKSGGNPFYMREFMSACHRTNCIWYDYKQGTWNYDIDRIFQKFSTDKYDDVLNADFVTRRLGELPLASRSILSWASLIGTSFSFELVQKLLSGEFDYKESETSNLNGDAPWQPLSHPQKEAVGGLQAAIQAYIIVTTDDDDRFRFAHDRYLQAAASLRPEGAKMHFIIGKQIYWFKSFPLCL